MPIEFITPLKWILYAAAAFVGVYVLCVVGVLLLGLLLVSRK